MRRHRTPAGAQDLDGLCVRPVVDHGLEEVGVPAFRDRVEEAAPDHPAALRHSGSRTAVRARRPRHRAGRRARRRPRGSAAQRPTAASPGRRRRRRPCRTDRSRRQRRPRQRPLGTRPSWPRRRRSARRDAWRGSPRPTPRGQLQTRSHPCGCCAPASHTSASGTAGRQVALSRRPNAAHLPARRHRVRCSRTSRRRR